MIKIVRAFQDSQGAFHVTRESACMAEFRRMLTDKFAPNGSFELEAPPAIRVDTLVNYMFEIDKMIGEACKEDSRAELNLSQDINTLGFHVVGDHEPKGKR